MNAASNIGKFPEADTPSFKQHCLNLLEYQILAMKPRLVITLGRFVPSLITDLSDNLAAWKTTKSIQKLDDQNLQLIKNVQFKEMMATNFVVLTHPAQRHLNIRYRNYNNLSGHDAEIAMLRYVIN